VTRRDGLQDILATTTAEAPKRLEACHLVEKAKLARKSRSYVQQLM